jgi:hypothetical protein
MGTASNKSVAERLFIKPGHLVRFINAPTDAKKLLGNLPNGASLVQSGAADVTLFFAGSVRELDAHLNEALKAAQTNLWIAYPKIESAKSDLSRQVVHDAFARSGWKPVAQISVDDTWSAIRGRPA